jgi:hypothetical protein
MLYNNIQTTMPPSSPIPCTYSRNVRPFGNGNERTGATCETPTPQQPSTPLSMRALPGFGSGVNIGAAMIRPM